MLCRYPLFALLRYTKEHSAFRVVWTALSQAGQP